MQPALAPAQVLLARHRRVGNVHGDAPCPAQRIPLTLVLDVVCDDEKDEDEDADVGRDEIRCTERAQERPPSVEKQEQAAGAEPVRRSQPLKM